MVNLFFYQFFWVSNWNIFDESKAYSYTLKGAEYNGKVFFSHKQNPCNIFGTTSSFLWVSHQKKWKEFFCRKKPYHQIPHPSKCRKENYSHPICSNLTPKKIDGKISVP